MSTITQQQLNRFFEILAASKLPSELTELLNPTASHFATVQSGTSDAVKISLPNLRGDKGEYNASTNVPALVNGTGIGGDSYVVSVGGTRDFGSGNVQLIEGDIIEYKSGKWRKVTGSPAINQIEFYADWETRPETGSNEVLYVDLTNFKLYLWDSVNAEYVNSTGTGSELTAQAIIQALGYTPANDSEVVKGILNSDGTEIPKDVNGKVTLPEFGSSFTTDESLYLDPATDVLRANVSTYSQTLTKTAGGNQVFTLDFEPTNFLAVHSRISLFESDYIFTPPNTLEIIPEMADGEKLRVVYERFIEQPT